MGKKSLENLIVYQKAQLISDLAWEIVKILPGKEDHPAGNQFIRCIDSISANISEGYGRFTYKDKAHFMIIARGSLKESEDWRVKLEKRYKVPEQENHELSVLLKEESFLLNRYIKYLRSRQNSSQPRSGSPQR